MALLYQRRGGKVNGKRMQGSMGAREKGRNGQE
jgi:hypothetical protein